MKSVLLSIHPKWVHKILDGPKTIEIRKTRPKIETPFKCYIYCTKGDEVLAYHDYCGFDMEDFSGDFIANTKVVAEFTCDRIDPIRVFNNGTIQNWMNYGLERSCVPYDEIVKYIGNNRSGYGWHISCLKVYEKPKPLSWFVTEGDCDCMNCKKCGWFNKGNGYNVEDDCDLGYENIGRETPLKPLFRPPQSWCYVEEVPGC